MSDSKKRNSLDRAFVLALLGAFLGAPAGAMVAACVASVLGSFDGFFGGFGKAIDAGFPWGFLVRSLDNVGRGAGEWAGKWTVVGAKAGPIAGATLGFALAFVPMEERDSKPEASTRIGGDKSSSWSTSMIEALSGRERRVRRGAVERATEAIGDFIMKCLPLDKRRLDCEEDRGTCFSD